MKVVMLAAGIGSRLGRQSSEDSPKILLRFEGKSLLERHIEILKAHGVSELVIGVGHRRHEIEAKIEAIGAQGFVRTVYNKDFAQGSVVTLWTLRDELCCGQPVILMDADVLYDDEMFRRLLKSQHPNCLLLDRGFVDGDEPVKICVRDGEIIEFRKWLSADFDFSGESIGFFKLSASEATRIIAQAELYVLGGRRLDPYEDAIRDVLLTSRNGTYSFEDVTGIPWIEIDFAEDILRAANQILPDILIAQKERGLATQVNESSDATSERIL